MSQIFQEFFPSIFAKKFFFYFPLQSQRNPKEEKTCSPACFYEETATRPKEERLRDEYGVRIFSPFTQETESHLLLHSLQKMLLMAGLEQSESPSLPQQGISIFSSRREILESSISARALHPLQYSSCSEMGSPHSSPAREPT